MTEEQRRKAQWLNRAFNADRLSHALEDKLERDQSLAERLTRYSDGTGGGGAGNSTEDALIRLSETRSKLQEKLTELESIRAEVYNAICTVDDESLRSILIWRYLDYKSMEQIADRMHYVRRTVHRKFLDALDKMSLNVTPHL